MTDNTNIIQGSSCMNCSIGVAFRRLIDIRLVDIVWDNKVSKIMYGVGNCILLEIDSPSTPYEEKI